MPKKTRRRRSLIGKKPRPARQEPVPEPWVAPPHWPKPRYVSSAKMGRVPAPPAPPEPLLTPQEQQIFIGVLIVAVGFVLTGLGGIIGLWIVLGDLVLAQLWGA